MRRFIAVAVILAALVLTGCSDFTFDPENPLGALTYALDYNSFGDVETTPGDALDDVDLSSLVSDETDGTATVDLTNPTVIATLDAITGAVDDNSYIAGLTVSSDMSDEEKTEVEAEKKEAVTFLTTSLIAAANDDEEDGYTEEESTLIQSTAIAVATIETATTGGDAFVTNLGNMLTTMMPNDDTGDPGDTGGTEDPDVQSIVSSLIPTTMYTETDEVDTEGNPVLELDKDSFTSMVDGLVAAADAYEILGSSMQSETVVDPDTGETTEVPVYEDETIIANDIAQAVIVSSVVSSLTESISVGITDANLAGSDDPEQNVEPAEVIYEIVTNPEAITTNSANEPVVIVPVKDADGNDTTVEVPVDLNSFDPFSVLETDSGTGTANILSASSIGDLLSGFLPSSTEE